MIFWSLIALVVLAPLPLASARPWSWGLMATFVGLLLVAWGVKTWRDEAAPAVGLRRTWFILFVFGLAAGWGVAQMLPLTPPTWHHPLWTDAVSALGVPVTGAVSVDPFETGTALLRLLTYAGIFWLSLQYCRSAKRARQVFLALALAGLLYSAYGLVIGFSGARMVLWFEKEAYVDNLTSTFVNRNSYATYAGLTLLCATGLLIALLSGAIGDHLGSRERTRGLLQAIAGRGSALLVAFVVIVTALLLTDSRGGFLSTVLGVLALLVAVGSTPTMRLRHALAMALPVLGAGIAFFLFSGETTAERLAGTTIESEERARVYEITLEAIGDAPLRGTGYGTFEQVFRIYRDERVLGIYDKTHNTYLENVLELGLPAASLLFLSIAALFARCLIGVRTRRRDVVYPCIGVGATVLVAAHSLVDFSLQIPAVAATYALLMGAAVAQSWSSRDRPAPMRDERP